MRNALPPASPLRAKRPKHLQDQLSWHNRVSAGPVNGISTDSPFFFTPTTHSPPRNQEPRPSSTPPPNRGKPLGRLSELGSAESGLGFFYPDRANLLDQVHWVRYKVRLVEMVETDAQIRNGVQAKGLRSTPSVGEVRIQRASPA